MYSRRLKLSKKKTKPGRQKQSAGSNWGPRLAIIERERALAGGPVAAGNGEPLEEDEEEELYEIHEAASSHHRNNMKQQHPPSVSSSGGGKQQTYQQLGSTKSEDPILQLGRSSSPNYFYYNYSRRTAPNGGAQRKISCPEPQISQYGRYASHLPDHDPNQPPQRQRRASYVLGSSSGYNSGSVTTLSTCANNLNSNNLDPFSKPLTLIIPSHHGNGGASKLMHRQDYDINDFGTEDQHSQDSFPSSNAYQSSGDEDRPVQPVHTKRHFHNPLAHMNRHPNRKLSSSAGSGASGGLGGILQISQKEVVQVHAPPQMSPSLPPIPQEGYRRGSEGDSTEPETLDIGAQEENEHQHQNSEKNKNKTGSTITALAHGVTMVYVPMEERRNNGQTNESEMSSGDYGGDLLPDYNEHVDLPELGRHLGGGSDNDNENDYNTSASTGSSGGGNRNQAGCEQDDSLTSNFILKKKTQPPVHENSLLLDSFNSILFKPKPGDGLQKCQEHYTKDTHNNLAPPPLPPPEHKGIRKRPEQPPPLPPGNGKPTENNKQKSLRFALDNLETVLNPSSLSSTVESNATDNSQQFSPSQAAPVSSSPTKKVLKKVTLSLPGHDNISSRNHELLLNYEELNTASSEVLSCGHVRNDDYSTLSSLTSSAQEISDLEECSVLGINNNNNNGGEGSGRSSNNSNNNNSGAESDAGGSGGSGIGSADPAVVVVAKKHEPRSVLQQLKDLSRLIRGSSPTKTKTPKDNDPKSFYLHDNSQNSDNDKKDMEIAKRKTSDATDNSADSGKGSGSGSSSATSASASGSGSSGQEGSSSSAEPSPNRNLATNGKCASNNKINNPNSRRASVTSNTVTQKLQDNQRRLKVATIRGRGGGTGSHHHYSAMCADEHCLQGGRGDPEVGEESSCSCPDCCDYRSDCTECVHQSVNYGQKRRSSVVGFPKPSSSQELCSNSNEGTVTRKKVPPPPHKTRTVVSKIVRRQSSRIRARRSASLKRQQRAERHLASNGHSNNRKPVILDYCDCANCDLDVDQCGQAEDSYEEEEDEEVAESYHHVEKNYCHPRHQRGPRYHEPLLIPVINKKGGVSISSSASSTSKCNSSKTNLPIHAQNPPDPRKISSSSTSSGISSSSSAAKGKMSRISGFRTSNLTVQQHLQNHQQALVSKSVKSKPSKLLRQSDAASTGVAIANHPASLIPNSIVAPPTSAGNSNLFTIDEANEESVYGGDSANGAGCNTGGGGAHPVVFGKGLRHCDESVNNINMNIHHSANAKVMRSSHSQHSHPNCWLAPDATLGWSDLESLYSQNMRSVGKKGSHSRTPAVLRDECPTCWKELSEMKKNCPDPNRTVDRTKRMFIWLNRRHKEFHAPWWEAKKQASMRWLVTKAFSQVVPKDKMPDPFKESKKGKPTKYSLRDDIVKGLVSGRLYCMALDSLYRSQQNNYHLSQNLTHWEIIKILSRRGIYIAQPSDMKLTETTLRQKKPIRTAAHIALIEALMGLYAKEILGRDRITATLRSFGKFIDPDTNSPERLVISWINTAVTTLKSYILSNAPQNLPSNKTTRWLHLPDVGEIRDLCDGVGICALFAIYFSNLMKIEEISVPEPGDTLTIYDSITNHSMVQKLCEDLFPEPIYHLCVTDFLYIHGCMKQNILCFLVDLFLHLEISPILRVNRLTHVPIRVEL